MTDADLPKIERVIHFPFLVFTDNWIQSELTDRLFPKENKIHIGNLEKAGSYFSSI